MRSLDRALTIATAALGASPALAYLVGAWDPYWKLITNLGDEPAYIALSVLTYAIASPKLGLYALLSLMTSGWANVLLKNALALPRPPRELWKVEVSGYGFPSGHAQTSSAFWSALALGSRSVGATALGTGIVALVSYSRLELGVHYLHDVLGGAFLGLLLSVAVVWALRSLEELKARWRSLALAAYGLLVASLYALQRDLIFVRAGGVLVGLAAQPLIPSPTAPTAYRALGGSISLVLAFLLTRAAGGLGPAAQFLFYSLAALVAISSIPLSHSLHALRRKVQK